MFKIGDYKTVGGLEAKILLIDTSANYPLIGAIRSNPGWWVPVCWDVQGHIHDPDEDYESFYHEDDEDFDETVAYTRDEYSEADLTK